MKKQFKQSTVTGSDRRPVASVRDGHEDSFGSDTSALQPAVERHYSVPEIAQLWNLSEKTVRRMFLNQPGVIEWGSEETLHKRGYRTLRIPESVLVRVHGRLRMA